MACVCQRFVIYNDFYLVQLPEVGSYYHKEKQSSSNNSQNGTAEIPVFRTRIQKCSTVHELSCHWISLMHLHYEIMFQSVENSVHHAGQRKQSLLKLCLPLNKLQVEMRFQSSLAHLEIHSSPSYTPLVPLPFGAFSLGFNGGLCPHAGQQVHAGMLLEMETVQ